jgi:hypothetical protein
MKNLLLLIVIVNLLLLQACNVNDAHDITPPSPPTGIQVLNGDNRVDLSWNNNREGDLAGYNIYYSSSYDGKYFLLGSSSVNYYNDLGAINGVKNYYAVTAYDQNGNESDLSKDVAYATPRPEGYDQVIYDYRTFPNSSGYSFGTYSVVAFDSILADVFFENYNGTFYLDVWTDSDILDAGLTTDILDISTAPRSGWSTSKDVIAKVGHTYVIRTVEYNYAKMRINSISNDKLTFDWAYQSVPYNTQLKPSNRLNDRKSRILQRNFIR